MPCPSDFYRGGREDNRRWQNWLRNVSYTVPSYFQPSSRQDLAWILKEAEARGKKVKAVGSGWSFEDCAASEDWVVDLRRLDHTITFLTHPATGPTYLTPAWAARQFRASPEKLYHVEAGIRMIDLNQSLEREGLAMLTLGGSQGQTLAGAISTSTHGSDLDQPPLPGVIQAIHLVTTGGQEVWIEAASEPVTANDGALRSALVCSDLQIIRDDELLRAAMVTVGRFGVIYAYVIKVTAFYRLAEWTQELPWADVAGALAAGAGQGSGVPAQAHLGGLPGLLSDPPAGLGISTPAGSFRFLDILVNPALKARHGDEVCWVRRRWLTQNKKALNIEDSQNPLCHKGVANILLTVAGAALAAYAGQVALIPVYGTIKAIAIGKHVTYLSALAHDPHITGGEALAETLEAVWASQIDHELEWLVAEVNHISLGNGLGESRNAGIRGPGWQVMAGLTEGTTGECYRANSTELVFSTETSAYIDFVHRLLDSAGNYHIGGFISIRFSSRSAAYLSMHNVRTPLAVSIEVTSLFGLEDSRDWVAFAEKTAREMGGRPHWGQQNRMTTLDLLNLYDLNDLQTWWHQCFRMVGPTSQTFSNAYTRQRGLEPLRRPDTAAMRVSPPLLDFGEVLRHTPARREHGLVVSSVGAGPLTVLGMRLLGPQAAAFTAEPHLPGGFPAALPPGAAFPISIQFQGPIEGGPLTGEHQARLVLSGRDDRSGSTLTVEANLQAGVVAPDMEVLPRAINFGLVQAGQQVLRNLLITNNGSAPLRFRVGPPAAESPFQWAGDGPEAWRSLASGEAEVLGVRYRPAAAGRHRGRVSILSDAESAQVDLFGERAPAVKPEIHASPPQLSFGVVSLGTTETQRLALSNGGAALLKIGAVRIEGPENPLFALAGRAPASIKPGQTAALGVSFTPPAKVAKGHQATLVIESNAGNAPVLKVGLYGAGAAASLLVAPAEIAFNPSPLAPALPAGLGSRRSFNLYNVGAVPLTLAGSSFRVLEAGSGQVSPHFELLDGAGQPFPQNDLTLKSGAFQSLSVQFRPTTAGAHAARVEIRPTGRARLPVRVSITGEGAP